MADSLNLPDYSEYLTPERAAWEESAWAVAGHYERNAGNIITAAKLFSLGESFRLLELGCGSGWVPTVLPESIHYHGIDNNSMLLDFARGKNSPTREFQQSDIRAFVPASPVDLVASFAVLKHFSLAEFPIVFRRMLTLAPYGVFNIQIAPSAYDNGTEFHHTWMTEEIVRSVARSADREIFAMDTLYSGELGEDRIFHIGIGIGIAAGAGTGAAK